MAMSRPVLPFLAAASVSVLFAAGCATPPPVVAATVNFSRTDCAASPNLAAATSLTPPKEKAVHSVTGALDGQALCLTRNGKATPYVVYALPSDHEDKTLTVGAVLEGVRLVSPEVAVLDPRSSKPNLHSVRLLLSRPRLFGAFPAAGRRGLCSGHGGCRAGRSAI
jgi:hypothetical protein